MKEFVIDAIHEVTLTKVQMVITRETREEALEYFAQNKKDFKILKFSEKVIDSEVEG